MDNELIQIVEKWEHETEQPTPLAPVPITGMMDRVCGWCHKPMGQKPGTPGQITHSMCPECFDNWMAQIKALKQLKGQK